MRNSGTRSCAIAVLLLAAFGLALGQEHSDERLDALGYELMHRAGAEPVDCPREVLAESRYSILFCGSPGTAKREWIAAVKEIADALVHDTGTASRWLMADGWETNEGWSRRHYFVYDAIVTVGVRRNPGIVFLNYPWRFPDCLAEPPLPAGRAGERIAPRIILDSLEPRPIYPELARVARLEAAVFLQGRISKEGNPEDLCLQHVTRPNMGFEEAAIEAVGRWRYEPATIGGEPVEVRWSVTVDFVLH